MNKKIVTAALTISAVFLISITFGMQTVKFATAQPSGTIIINSDGNVIGTNKIIKQGNVYTLVSNLSAGIQVQRGNIIINGAGFAVVRADIDLRNGVDTNPSNPTIQKVTIINLIVEEGSVITNGGGSNVFYNDIIGGGILLRCDYCLIKHCFVNSILLDYGADNNVITENNLNGIVVSNSNNTIDKNYWSGILTPNNQDNNPLTKPITISLTASASSAPSPILTPTKIPTPTTIKTPTISPNDPTVPPTQQQAPTSTPIETATLTLTTDQPTLPSLEIPTFSMPLEYLTYTITIRQGTPWAIVEGTYPIFFPNAVDQEPISMVYPTPPGTTNITLAVNGTQLIWTNYTEQFPDALHHTALGDWPMIATTFEASTFFTLTIHYEHPIAQEADGTYQFLYDLNISPYLAPETPTSTAYFTVNFEKPCTDLQVSTTPQDGILNPISYDVSGQTPTVTFEVTSEFAKPLPGDVMVQFAGDFSKNVPESAFTWSQFWLIAALLTAITAGIVYFRRRKNGAK